MASVREQFDAFALYLRSHEGRILLHLAVLGILYLGLRGAGRSVRGWAQAEPNLRRTARVFDRPLAAAVVLSIMAVDSLYPDAPRMLQALLGLLALAPSILLVEGLVGKRLLPLLYGLLALYGVYLVRLVLEPVPQSARLVFVLECLAAVLFLAWLLHSSRGQASPWLIWGLQIGLVLVSLALVAACMGNVSLAYLTADVLLRSSILSLVLLAAVEILDGLTLYLLRVRPFSLLQAVSRHRLVVRKFVGRGFRLLALLIWVLYTLELRPCEVRPRRPSKPA
jgi:hypothetical protein